MTLSPRFDPYRAAMVPSVIPLAKAAEPEMPPVVYTLLGVPYTVVPDRRHGFLFKAARRKPAPGQLGLFDAPKPTKAPGTGGRKKKQEGATRMKNGRQQVLKNSRWRNTEPKGKATPKPGLSILSDDTGTTLKPKARKGKEWGADAPAKAPAAVGSEAMGATSLRTKGSRKNADKDIDVAKIRRMVGINLDQALSDSIDEVDQVRSDSGKISRELAHTALIAADTAHNGYLTLGDIAYHHNIGGHAKYTEPLTDVFAQHPDLKEQYPEVAKAVLPRDSKKPWFATHEYDSKEDIWDNSESPNVDESTSNQSEYDSWLDWSESEEARVLSSRATKIAMYAAVNNFDNLIGGINKGNWSKDEASAVVGQMVKQGFIPEERLEKLQRLTNDAPATPAEAENLLASIPDGVQSRVKAAGASVKAWNRKVEIARQTDQQFQGDGRYTWEATNGEQMIEPETIQTFRDLASQKGIDADAALNALGYEPPIQLGDKELSDNAPQLEPTLGDMLPEQKAGAGEPPTIHSERMSKLNSLANQASEFPPGVTRKTAKEGFRKLQEALSRGDTTVPKLLRDWERQNITPEEAMWRVHSYGQGQDPYQPMPAPESAEPTSDWESKLNELKQVGSEMSSPPKRDDEAKTGPSPIPYDRHLLKNRISQGYMESRAFYARAVNTLDNALMNGKEVKLYPDEVSNYGAKLVMEIDGKREPLTKSKLKKKDLAFFLSANVLSTLDL